MYDKMYHRDDKQMEEQALVKDELIGKTDTIRDCTDPSWIGYSGVIVDETKHTFLIEKDDRQRTIAKKTAIFEFDHQDKKTLVEGVRLDFRPEDRIKKAR